MYVLVLYIPLISAIIVGFFGRFLDRKGAYIFSTSYYLCFTMVTGVCVKYFFT